MSGIAYKTREGGEKKIELKLKKAAWSNASVKTRNQNSEKEAK